MNKIIEIFVRQEGQRDPILREAHDGATIAALKAQLGNEDTSFFLFEEDADEPLLDDYLIRHSGDGLKVIHRHRCKSIEVSVRYAGRQVSREFGPGSTLDRIKRWAERKLKIDDVDAAEMSLQITGSVDRPDGSTHVGSLVSCPGCKIDFDLVPTDRVNGCQ